MVLHRLKQACQSGSECWSDSNFEMYLFSLLQRRWRTGPTTCHRLHPLMCRMSQTHCFMFTNAHSLVCVKYMCRVMRLACFLSSKMSLSWLCSYYGGNQRSESTQTCYVTPIQRDCASAHKSCIPLSHVNFWQLVEHVSDSRQLEWKN